MKEILAVTLYILEHLFIPAMLVLIVHAIILSVLSRARVYKMISYFLFSGLWIAYAHRMVNHDGLQKYWIYMAILGAVVIVLICKLLNRSSKPA